MNNNIHNIKAKKLKNDEFYTKYEDIAAEIINYKKYLKNKIIYCNCDNENSNFVKYFKNNYDFYQLKGLIYSANDFRDPKNIQNLINCDIVITNPPFSIKKEFLNLLSAYNKQFIIVMPNSALANKALIHYANNIYTGYNTLNKFDNTETKVVCYWCQNMIKHYSNKKIKYIQRIPDKSEYYKNILNVDSINNIPTEYNGLIAIPTTLFNYDYSCYNILGVIKPIINKKMKYVRILCEVKKEC